MSSKVVLRPPRDLVSGAKALEDPQRLAGKWPYQWIFPGPHSRQVLENQAAPVPTIGTSIQLLSYLVPDGLRFSLRGVVFAFFGSGWNEGSGDLVFSLTVQAAGTRDVDYLNNVTTHLGSPDFPYPILGRLEFAPEDVLIVNLANNANVVAGSPNFVVAHLVGHTYPNSEAL